MPRVLTPLISTVSFVTSPAFSALRCPPLCGGGRRRPIWPSKGGGWNVRMKNVSNWNAMSSMDAMFNSTSEDARLRAHYLLLRHGGLQGELAVAVFLATGNHVVDHA